MNSALPASRWALAPLTALVSAIGSPVELEALPAGTGGYYETATGRITLNRSRSVNGQVATLVHELAHALVRVDRDDDDPALDYAQDDLVVESVAYTVCARSISTSPATRSPTWRRGQSALSCRTIEQTAKLIDRLPRRIEDAAHTAAAQAPAAPAAA